MRLLEVIGGYWRLLEVIRGYWRLLRLLDFLRFINFRFWTKFILKF